MPATDSPAGPVVPAVHDGAGRGGLGSRGETRGRVAWRGGPESPVVGAAAGRRRRARAGVASPRGAVSGSRLAVGGRLASDSQPPLRGGSLDRDHGGPPRRHLGHSVDSAAARGGTAEQGPMSACSSGRAPLARGALEQARACPERRKRPHPPGAFAGTMVETMNHRLLALVFGLFFLAGAGCGGGGPWPASPRPRCSPPLRRSSPTTARAFEAPSRRSPTSRVIALLRRHFNAIMPGHRSRGPPLARGQREHQDALAGLQRRLGPAQPQASRELPGSLPAAHRRVGLPDRRRGLLRLAHSAGPVGRRAGVSRLRSAARAVGRGAGPHPVSGLSLLESRDELRLRGRIPGLPLGPGKPVVSRHRRDGHLGVPDRGQGPRARGSQPPVPVRPLHGGLRRVVHRPQIGRRLGRPRNPRGCPLVRPARGGRDRGHLASGRPHVLRRRHLRRSPRREPDRLRAAPGRGQSHELAFVTFPGGHEYRQPDVEQMYLWMREFDDGRRAAASA